MGSFNILCLVNNLNSKLAIEWRCGMKESFNTLQYCFKMESVDKQQLKAVPAYACQGINISVTHHTGQH
jgi:hypothetical protein